MTKRSARRIVGFVGIAYCAGALTAHWTWIRMSEDPGEIPPNDQPGDVRPAPAPPHEEPAATATIGESEAVVDLRRRNLLLPVDGIERDQLRQSFEENRDGRSHEAIDIVAPRDTPVRAVEDGRIAKLFMSQRGGLTIYQFDSSEQYCYYYAHLERYAHGLQDGQHVQRGQIVGYVGTSGNAPPNTPHLHFAIFALGPDKRWWEGEPIDPYPALR